MNIQIIIGSTRKERVSPLLAKWVANNAEDYFDEVELVDLKDYPMPFFDEPVSPQFNPSRQTYPEARRWLNKLSEADAYIIVTPEYNRSFSSVLKNALDYIDFQFEKKPVAIVGHGSTGGAQAVAHLRGVMAGLKTFTTPAATYVSGRIAELINERGEIKDKTVAENPYGPQGALKGTLTELQFFAEALTPARLNSLEPATA